MTTSMACSIKPQIPFSLLIIIPFIFALMEGDSLSFGYLNFALYGLWIITAAFENVTALKKALSNRIALVAFGYILWRTLLSLLNCDSAISVIGMSLNLLTFFSGTVIAPYYINRNKNLNLFFYICASVYLFYCIKGILFYIANPEAARLYTAHEFETTVAGGYGLGFGVSLITVYLWGIFLRSKQEGLSFKHAILILLVVCSGIYLCYLIRSTIILLATVIGILYQLMVHAKSIKVQSKKNIYQLLIFIAVIVAVFNWKIIAEGFIEANQVEKNATTDRLAVIGEYLLFGTESDTITGRTNLYGDAIYALMESPILGKSLSVKYEDMNKVMKGHSAILDPFGAYGLLGGILCFLAYWRLFKSMKYRKQCHLSGVVVTWFIFAMFNPIPQSSAGCLIFLMLPFLDIFFYSRYIQISNESIH